MTERGRTEEAPTQIEVFFDRMLAFLRDNGYMAAADDVEATFDGTFDLEAASEPPTPRTDLEKQAYDWLNSKSGLLKHLDKNLAAILPGYLTNFALSLRLSEPPTQPATTSNYVANDVTYPTQVVFADGRVVSIIPRDDGSGLPCLAVSPKSEYPKPCGICDGVIQSKDDLDWHGYGNCRDVPEAMWDKPELPPLAMFLTHAREFTMQEDATKAMQMGKEIADGVANFMKLAAAAPTGQSAISRDAEAFYALPECPACNGSGKVLPCPSCGSNSDMRWCSNPAHGKNVHAFVKFECIRCEDKFHTGAPTGQWVKDAAKGEK